MTQQVFLNSPYLVPSAVDWAVAPFTQKQRHVAQKRAPAMANNVNIQNFYTFFDGIHPQTKYLKVINFSDSISEQAPIVCCKIIRGE